MSCRSSKGYVAVVVDFLISCVNFPGFPDIEVHDCSHS